MDQSNIPVVVNHHITEGRTTYYVGDRLNLGGRRVMGVDVKQRGEIAFKMRVLEGT